MRRIISISLVCLLMTGLFSACGKSLEADRDTVYIQKKGSIIGAAIADFDKDYYDEEELKAFAEERVQEYQEEHGKNSVTIDKFSVEEGTAKLYMKYAGYEDYQEFNEVTLFSGTVPQALAAGFTFDTDFTKIKDGKAAGSVENTEVEVKVDGSVQYMSSDYTSLKGKDTVTVQVPEEAGDGEELSLVYIVYK